VVYQKQKSEVAVAVVAMTQALEQALRAIVRCRKKPYLRHGRIDKNRLVAITKGLSKEVFYRKSRGEELDVAVEIVIDESGSMDCTYEDVRLVAIAVGESLAQIGIPFEITGTTTQRGGGYGGHQIEAVGGEENFTRYNPIVYKHYKTFGEQWGTVRQRIVNSSHHQNNVDGEAVEYAAYRLAQRKEARRIIFSLSDGEPCAGQGNDDEMAANLIRVCKRVRKSGIEVYGFGVGTQDRHSAARQRS
jgi:cobaltochelatase CobT